jgi:hypothetical protein
VVIEPDVAKIFPDHDSVNQALRSLAKIIKRQKNLHNDCINLADEPRQVDASFDGRLRHELSGDEKLSRLVNGLDSDSHLGRNNCG